MLATLFACSTLAWVAMYRRRPPAAGSGLEILGRLFPALWLFSFTALLIHMTSDLIPARKHPSFAANALASAGAFTLLVFFAPERYRSRVAGALGILLTGLALGDMIYMRYFGGVIPWGSLVSTGQLWDVRRSIESLFEARDVKLLPLLVAAFAILFLPGAQFALSRKRLLAVYLLPILACSYACVVATRDVHDEAQHRHAVVQTHHADA